jgi:hypothetical protein
MKSRMLEEMVGLYRKSAGTRAPRKCVLFNLEEVEAKMEEVCNFFLVTKFSGGLFRRRQIFASLKNSILKGILGPLPMSHFQVGLWGKYFEQNHQQALILLGEMAYQCTNYIACAQSLARIGFAAKKQAYSKDQTLIF